jgi:phospholipid transport system substrate-binding protein
MRMINGIKKCLSSLVITAVFSSIGWCATDPMPMVVQMNAQVIGTLKKHKSELKAHPQYVEQAIKTYFIPHVDTQGMSRSVLGRNIWQTATIDEKIQFTSEFTNLVLRTYAQPLVNFNGEKVEFLPMKPSATPKFSQIKSIVVRPNGQRIPITYHLVQSNDEWKIYDLSVEGVSLLNSFRSQFGDALKQDSLKTVIHALHEKNKKHSS